MKEIRKIIKKLICEELDKNKKIKVYHGTLLSNFKEMSDDKPFILNFTPLYDDAVMYALMGGESRFLGTVREMTGEDDKFEELWQNAGEPGGQLEILKYTFPKNDKPVLLEVIYEKKHEFDEDYEMDLKISKKDIKAKTVSFNEFYKISPIWASFSNYFF